MSRRRAVGPTRPGVATIWGLASMGLLLALAALVVDGALLYSSHTDLQIAADSGALASEKVLEAEIYRMLEDSKSESLVRNFAGQWLQLRNLNDVVRDSNKFPDFDEDSLDFDEVPFGN